MYSAYCPLKRGVLQQLSSKIGSYFIRVVSKGLKFKKEMLYF